MICRMQMFQHHICFEFKTLKPHLRTKHIVSYINTDSWIQRLMEVTTRRTTRAWLV